MKNWWLKTMDKKKIKIWQVNWTEQVELLKRRCLSMLSILFSKTALSNFNAWIFSSLKGSLHTSIFSKYTELLQWKNVFTIFWNYFWNILEINVFQNKNPSSWKKRGCFLKKTDTDNNKLMGLLTIAGGSLLLSQEHIKEKRKQRIFGKEREIIRSISFEHAWSQFDG